MSLIGMLTGKKLPPEESLLKQKEALDSLHDNLKEMAKELEEIKTHLVHKANGSFYPFLSKAGGKEESS